MTTTPVDTARIALRGTRMNATATDDFHLRPRQPVDRTGVLGVMARHIGAARGVSVGNLVYELTGQPPTLSAERQVRDVMLSLRLDGYHVCAHPSTGYFMAASSTELEATCRFLVDRAMASLTQVSRMKRIALPDLYGQLRIPL